MTARLVRDPGMGPVDPETAALAAKLRRQHAESVEAYMNWGTTPEERAEWDKEDAAYFAARRAEFAAEDRATRDAEADERIHNRMRAQDDAVVPGQLDRWDRRK